MTRCRALLAAVLWVVVAACGNETGTEADEPGTSAPPAPARRTPAGPPDHVQVVVVGGGLAGLVTAYELEKAGVSTHVLEASNVWGGRVATVYYGPGLQGEYGMQEVWDGNPLLDVARELHVRIDGAPYAAYSSVQIDGEVYPFIADTMDDYLASMFTTAEKTAFRTWQTRAQRLYEVAEREGVANAEVRALVEPSFEQWIGTQSLPHKVAEFVRLTIECELAADWASFSALIGLLEFRVFFGQEGAGNSHVAGGNLKLIDALVSAIHGGKTLNATVNRIVHAPGERVRVQYVQDHVLREIEADRVVVAVPFVRLPGIEFEPPLSDGKWQAVNSLVRGQYVVVHFLMDKQADALWNLDGQSPFPVLTRGPLGVIYGVNETSPPTQPLQVFTLLIYGAPAQAFHMQPRDTKIRDALAELDRLWPGFSSHVHASYVYSYHPSAIPVWPPGRAPIDDLGRGLLAPEGNVYLTGDYTWSGHSEGAVRSAILQASKLVRDLGRASASAPATPNTPTGTPAPAASADGGTPP